MEISLFVFLTFEMYGFFTFYSRFDFEKYEVCVRQKELLEKRYKEWEEKRGLRRDQALVIIEDPFQLDNNVARNVRAKALENMRKEFQRGMAMCESFSTMTFQQLCQLQ